MRFGLGRPSGHEHAQVLGVGIGSVDATDDAPLVEHDDAVGQADQLVEVLRHQQDGGALRAARQQLLAHVLAGADIEAAGGLRHDHDLGVAREHARQQHLLDVAAAERGHAVAGPGLDAVALDEVLGMGFDGRPVEASARSEVVDALHDQVERDGQVQHQAGVAVLGDAPHARGHDRLRPAVGQLPAVDGDGARSRVAHAAEDLGQLGLAVAADAGHAHDLAGVHLQLDLVQRGQAVVAARGQAAHLQACLAVVPQWLLAADAEGGAADHHARQLALVGVTGGSAHHLAAAHDRDAIADGADLAQLVADEDDREALVDEATQRLEERVHLLRHEHGRGFVEDEHAAIARERLDDLHALLLADREVLDDRVGSNGDAEAVGSLLDRAAGSLEVESCAASPAEDDVLGDRHGLDQAEVLGDHADARGDGVAGGADGDRRAVDLDGAGVCGGEPVEDAHQRGLAGAVLSEQGVDLTLGQGQVHRVDGDEVAETLGDATQLGGQVTLAAVGGHRSRVLVGRPTRGSPTLREWPR